MYIFLIYSSVLLSPETDFDLENDENILSVKLSLLLMIQNAVLVFPYVGCM